MATAFTGRLAGRIFFTQREREDLMRMAATMDDVIQLNRGDPDLPTPPHIIAAAQRALEERRTRYTHWQGIPELRAALAEKLSRENNLRYSPDEIVVTTGAEEAIFVTVMALVETGDEVLMADPHYTPFARVVDVAGGRMVPVPTFERDRYAFRAGLVRPYLTARSKVLVLIDPHNPTGVVQPPDVLDELAALAREANLLVISDEIYEKLLYDGNQHRSIAAWPDMKERTILINGFSKAYSMTGFRIGYLAAPREVIEAVDVFKQVLTICPSSISQWAALAALQGPQDAVAETVRIYDERRRIIMDALTAMEIPYVRPDGTMYMFANITPTGLGSLEFCRRLLQDARVLMSPGSAFGAGEGYVRISWLVPTPRVREGMERLQTFLGQLSRRPQPQMEGTS